MKREILKTELIDYIKSLDTRAESFTNKEIDDILINSFGEFSTVSKSITNRFIVNLDPYYESGEIKFTIQLKEDVIYIYDLYLVKETDDLLLSKNGEYQYRDDNMIWRDPQKRDTFHVNLIDQKFGLRYDLAYCEYVYIPTNTDFDSIYMHNDAFIAFRDALAATVYDYLRDDEFASKKRSEMVRKASSIADIYPEDYEHPPKESMFPLGV